MKVTKNDLIGDIKNFPIEIVQKMCEKQIKQGNKFSPKIFQLNKYAEKSIGGFDWDRTDEGHDYWWNIIGGEIFHLFDPNPNPSTVYLVYYLTGNLYYNTPHNIFVTKDLEKAQTYVNRFNSILDKWNQIYSKYTHIDCGVEVLKDEFKHKYRRWIMLKENLGCKVEILELRK